MGRYVALLRGITPSGRNMANDKLRGVVEALGLVEVGSVLASGNITFTAAESDPDLLEERIERALAERLGLTSRTLVRERADLRALVDSDPFADLTHEAETYLTATFVKHQVTEMESLVGSAPSGHGIRFDPIARVLLAVIDNRDPSTSNAFMTWLDRACGKEATTRSWLTVQRVLRKLETP